MTKNIETTTETVETVKATKTKKAKREPKPQYPFRSKSSIKEDIETSDSFMLSCLQIMLDRQTDFEQESKSTVVKNRRGFMSSHAVVGTALAVKATTEGLNAEETDKARSIVLRYTKQLAEHFRAADIAANPELKAVAAMFSADVD